MTNLSSSSNFLDNRSFSLDKTWLQKAELTEMKAKVCLLHKIISAKFCHERSPSLLPFVASRLLLGFEQAQRFLFCKEAKVS